MTCGQRLVEDIKSQTIAKDSLHENGKEFSTGYAKLYLYKLKKYLSSVGKYIQDKRVTEPIGH